MAALLQLRAAFANWAQVERTEMLSWDAAAGPMCGGAWQGVTCDVSGSVVGLNLAAPNPPALSAVMSVDEMMRGESPRLSDLGLPAPPVDAMDSDYVIPPGVNGTVRGSSPVQLRGAHREHPDVPCGWRIKHEDDHAPRLIP